MANEKQGITWAQIFGIALGAAGILWLIWFLFGSESKDKPTTEDKNSTANLPKGKGNSTVPKGGVTGATVEQAFDPAYWRGLNKAGTINMTADDATRSKESAKDIYDAVSYSYPSLAASILTFGISNLFGYSLKAADFDKIKLVFSNANSKAFVSMIAQSFKNDNSKDLYTFLKDYLDPDQLQQIRVVVAGLADY